MLYIAPLFLLDEPMARFGYADDTAFLAISPTLGENCQTLSNSLQEALDWDLSEGITFAPDKYELLHLLRHQADQTPNITLSVSVGTVTIKENITRPYLRWLGILFDKKLSFKYHVREMASKALTVANALRSLSNTVRGVNPYLMQQAIKACVLSKVYYGIETWWPGYSRPDPRTETVSNRVQGHLDRVTKVILAGARAVLPVYRTTPIPALYRESGLLPAEIELDYRVATAAVRIRRLDPYHPLRRRAEKVIRIGLKKSRFARRVRALPKSEQINPLQNAPWLLQESREAAQQRIRAPAGQTKEQVASSFQNFYTYLPQTDIKVFTDGSKLANGMAGAGFALCQSGKLYQQSSFSLGPNKEVFDAEAEAALAGIKAALKLTTAYLATNLWICLDNLEVATRLLSTFSGSSQEVFNTFQDLVSSWSVRERYLYTGSSSVRICWVPGHMQIPENEAADQATKKGAGILSSLANKHSYASLRRQTKDDAISALQEYWQLKAPQSYQDLWIAKSPRCPAELKLPRHLLARILAARTGHGDFAAYHERFNHEDAHILCRCGARKISIHFLFCYIAKRRLPRLLGSPSETIPFLLGTPKGAAKLAAWLAEIRFFEDICTRSPLPQPD
ncbi:ribonuclease H family protein [Aspergillus affinis]|uniref:ribonuclease H family protein n=1 Tax=Aspergillus affinis TaxID=1070780 RepID=UPI0022FE5A2B|nr:uncharacterized protein KD926_004862 [Aspergillus affinis]KAI9034981.1 hypothetical protein KD926_004862 [Aspergillus affinis]